MWLFSRRKREAEAAWEKYPHREGEPMPVLWHAAFSMGVATAQRDPEPVRKIVKESGVS